jgi:hypothetical protein
MYPVEVAFCDATHWENTMDDDNLKAKKPKSSAKKKRKAEKITSVGMTDEAMNECLGILLQYRKKSRCFRQRVLDLKRANRVTKVRIIREIVETLEEMESGAHSAAEKLKARLPVALPLTQIDLAAYIAGRTAREAP